MSTMDAAVIFTPERLTAIFPEDTADAFFDALYGGAEEGAYDIRLVYEGGSATQMYFAFQLHQRAGHCLACNLTYGLPQVFARHPIIGLPRIVEAIAQAMGKEASTFTWELGRTQEHSRELHSIPLVISF